MAEVVFWDYSIKGFSITPAQGKCDLLMTNINFERKRITREIAVQWKKTREYK